VCGRRGGFLSLGPGRLAELVQRAASPGDCVRRDGGVAGGGIDPGVAEQRLNDPDVGAVFQQMRGKAMPPMSSKT